MQSDQLRAIQAPLKERYRQEPGEAIVTLKAQGRLGEGVTCKIETGKALAQAGLHPATGGDGLSVCSGDMLLEALVACAGVTLSAVGSASRCRADSSSRRQRCCHSQAATDYIKRPVAPSAMACSASSGRSPSISMRIGR